MKRTIPTLLSVFAMLLILTVTSWADTGPKPSVNVDVIHRGGRTCYVTLLSKYEQYGPYGAWKGIDESFKNPNYLVPAVWSAFYDYVDKDGFYFVQHGAALEESDRFSWNYYPPEPFKILLYLPDSQQYLVSDVMERYAFDSYYTIDLDLVTAGQTELDPAAGGEIKLNPETIVRSYDFSKEILGLIARIIITLIVEMAIAFVFGFRRGKPFRLLLLVNVVTQLILNIGLSVFHFLAGRGFTETLFYIMWEIAIICAESFAYRRWLRPLDTKKRDASFYTVYAIIANMASLFAGLLLASTFPSLF